MHGGEPANFLDVGGNASEGQVGDVRKIVFEVDVIERRSCVK